MFCIKWQAGTGELYTGLCGVMALSRLDGGCIMDFPSYQTAGSSMVKRTLLGSRSISGQFAAVFLFLGLCVPTAWACSCASGSEEGMVRRANLAVVATAIADAMFDHWGSEPHSPRGPLRAVTIFRIHQVLKGPIETDRIAVLHEIDSAACGLVFSPGVRYLLTFHIGRVDGPAPLRIGLCNVKVLDRPD